MKKHILSLLLLLVSISSYSVTYYAVANGPWNTVSIWSLTPGGVGGAGIPGAGDDVYTNGFIVGVTDIRTCRNIYVDDVTVNGLFVNAQLTITGTMIGHSRNLFGFLGPSPNNPTVDVVNGGSTILFTGVDTNTNGGATGLNVILGYWASVATIPNVTIGSGGTEIVSVSSGTSDISIGNLTISSGTLSFDALTVTAIQITGTLIVTGVLDGIVPMRGGSATSSAISTTTIDGTLTVGPTSYFNSNTINLNAGGILNVTNNEPNGWWHSSAASPTFSPDVSSTVSYNRGSNQGVGALTYGNLSVSSGGGAVTKNLSSTGTLDVLGDLTIAGSNTFSTSSNIGNITFRGDITNDGTLDVTRPTTFTGGGVHVVGGISPTTFSGTVTVNSSNAMDFNSAVIFGSTLTTGSNNISFAGNVTHAGVFNNTGTITFDGATVQSLAGAGSASFSNLTISNTSSSTATINNANTDVTGTLTMSTNARLNANGNITLVSTGTGSSATARVAAIPASATVSGNFVYERYISGAPQWHNIGLPISGSIADITSSGYPDPNASLGGDFVRYNEATAGDIDQGWESSKLPFSAIADTQGYTFWTRTADNNRTLQVTGALNTSNVSFPITRTVQNGLADDGWNLVNNPYASQIAWDALNAGGWSSSGIDATIYVWNGSAYNPHIGSGVIASGQSFWVHANAASPTLTATQAVKTSSAATFFREGEDKINDLTIKLKDTANVDLTRVRFMDNAIEEFDSEYDGYKLKNDIYNLSSITQAGMDLSINTIPLVENYRVVKLNITNIGAGSYELEFEDVSSFDIEITLVDHFLDKEEVLKDGYVYDFTVTSDTLSYGSERFEVIFGKEQIITAVNTAELSDHTIKLFPNPVGDQELTIKAVDLSSYQSMLMYNSQGKLMTTLTIDSDNEIKIDMSRFDKGVYFIHLIGQKGSTVHKILKN